MGIDRREMLKATAVAAGLIPLLGSLHPLVSRDEPEVRSKLCRNFWTNASGDGKASTPSNWSLGRVPGTAYGDTIVWDATCHDDCLVDVPLYTDSLDLDRGYNGTITVPATITALPV